MATDYTNEASGSPEIGVTRGPVRVAMLHDVQAFIERVQPHYKYGVLSVTQGKKYFKIIQDGSSAYGFVDNEGNVLKAATWSAPAKHARGNIFSDREGLEAIDAKGFVRYL